MAQKILVDTTPGFMQPTIYYSQGDVGTTFQIDLQSRFGDALPASPTVTIQATKPSGLGFSVAADSISSNIATFTLTETMSNEAGRFPAEVEISKNDVTLYTANFYIQVEASPHPEGTTDGDAETLIPTLTLLVERVETAASNILDMQVVAETLPAGSDATYSYDEATNTATFGIPRGADGSVTSVAGKTGAVTLDADDVAYDSTDTYASGTVGAELTAVKEDLKSEVGNSKTPIYQRDYDSFSDYPNGGASGTWANAFPYRAGTVEKLQIKTSASGNGKLWLYGSESKKIYAILSASGNGVIDIPVNMNIPEAFCIASSVSNIYYDVSANEPFYGFRSNSAFETELNNAKVGDTISVTYTTSGSSYYFAIAVVYTPIVENIVLINESIKEINEGIEESVSSRSVYQRGYDSFDSFVYDGASGVWLSAYAYPKGYINNIAVKVGGEAVGNLWLIGADSKKVYYIYNCFGSTGVINIPALIYMPEPFYIAQSISNIKYNADAVSPRYGYVNNTNFTNSINACHQGDTLTFTPSSSGQSYYFAIRVDYINQSLYLYNAEKKRLKENSASFAMFPTFGVIGDSFASGEIFLSSTSAPDSYWCSWGQTIAKHCAIRCKNYSHGGFDTKSFLLDGNDGLPKILSDDPLHLYILALGINDAANYGTSYIGTESDIGTENDTFFRNYGYIVNQISSHAPNAKIIMVTMAHTDDVRTKYNKAIREIADHFDIPIINELDDEFFQASEFWSTMSYNHPVATSYTGMGLAFMRLFGRCSLEYSDYFKDYYVPKAYGVNWWHD